jgi:hypothetical protein
MAIMAAVGHEPEKPGFKARVAPEGGETGEELDEDVLSDVHSGGRVGGVVEGYRVDAVLVAQE